jgi:hypothetical protein
MSAKILLVCTQAKRMILDAIALRTLWYAMALCFFFSVEDGCVEFRTTDELSQKAFTGPSNGTNIRNL